MCCLESRSVLYCRLPRLVDCLGVDCSGFEGEGVMRRRHLVLGGAAALMLSPALGSAQGLPVLRGCSVQQQGESLRLELELGAQVAYRSFSLSNPERLVIDLSGVSLQSPRMDPVPAGAAVTRIRSELHLDGLRVVLDLHSHVQPICVGRAVRWCWSLPPCPAAWRCPRVAVLQRQRRVGRRSHRSRPARACSPMWSPSTPPRRQGSGRGQCRCALRKICGHGGG